MPLPLLGSVAAGHLTIRFLFIICSSELRSRVNYSIVRTCLQNVWLIRSMFWRLISIFEKQLRERACLSDRSSSTLLVRIGLLIFFNYGGYIHDNTYIVQ
jgi:hypothetical protein